MMIIRHDQYLKHSITFGATMILFSQSRETHTTSYIYINILEYIIYIYIYLWHFVRTKNRWIIIWGAIAPPPYDPVWNPIDCRHWLLFNWLTTTTWVSGICVTAYSSNMMQGASRESSAQNRDAIIMPMQYIIIVSVSRSLLLLLLLYWNASRSRD